MHVFRLQHHISLYPLLLLLFASASAPVTVAGDCFLLLLILFTRCCLIRSLSAAYALFRVLLLSWPTHTHKHIYSHKHTRFYAHTYNAFVITSLFHPLSLPFCFHFMYLYRSCTSKQSSINRRLQQQKMVFPPPSRSSLLLLPSTQPFIYLLGRLELLRGHGRRIRNDCHRTLLAPSPSRHVRPHLLVLVLIVGHRRSLTTPSQGRGCDKSQKHEASAEDSQGSRVGRLHHQPRESLA